MEKIYGTIRGCTVINFFSLTLTQNCALWRLDRDGYSIGDAINFCVVSRFIINLLRCKLKYLKFSSISLR